MRGKHRQHACAGIITAWYSEVCVSFTLLAHGESSTETLPSFLQPSELQCAALVVQRHWLESGCRDWCPALRLQQCITPHCPVTGAIQQREREREDLKVWRPTELDQGPGLRTSGFLLSLCIDRHCRCLQKCFNVAIWPAAQPLMLGPSNWDPLKLHFKPFLLAKCISSIINFYMKLWKIIKHSKWW